MRVEDLVPPTEHMASFDLYVLHRITDTVGCYCLTNATGEILYAGQALSVRQRLIQHFDSGKRAALTPLGRISLVWWRSADILRLSALERGWLERIRLRDGQLPALNRISASL